MQQEATILTASIGRDTRLLHGGEAHKMPSGASEVKSGARVRGLSDLISGAPECRLGLLGVVVYPEAMLRGAVYLTHGKGI